MSCLLVDEFPDPVPVGKKQVGINSQENGVVQRFDTMPLYVPKMFGPRNPTNNRDVWARLTPQYRANRQCDTEHDAVLYTKKKHSEECDEPASGISPVKPDAFTQCVPVQQA